MCESSLASGLDLLMIHGAFLYLIINRIHIFMYTVSFNLQLSLKKTCIHWSSVCVSYAHSHTTLTPHKIPLIVL